MRKGNSMPFTIEAVRAIGPLVFTCSTASETLNRITELERQPHASITVRDGKGRSINIDDLTAPCKDETIRR
jgi:hypothetical protein